MMKNFVVIFVILSVASSKPIEEIDEEHAQTNPDQITASNGNHFGDKLSWKTPKDESKQHSLSNEETNFPEEPIPDDSTGKSRKSKRQLPDDVLINKQFFENIFQANRISRDTNDVPTIALSDLISSVEHTLIHSAQNLAASNFASNLNYSFSETTANNVTNTQHTSIVLPIDIPTPSPMLVDEFVTEVIEETESFEFTTVTEEDLIRDDRSSDDKLSESDDETHSELDDERHSEQDNEKHTEHETIDFESVKPIENFNLGILFPISLNQSANADEDEHTDAPAVTEDANLADQLAQQLAEQSNITIIKTINSTQLIPVQSSDVVHVHQQQITLFSANDGIFPNIHALNVEDLPIFAQTVESSSAPTEEEEEEDCSDEDTSNDSSDVESSSSDDKSSSSGESEEKEKLEKVTCTRKSSVITPTTSESSVTLSIETVKKIKTEELKEKIAEVEADPVILTQGI